MILSETARDQVIKNAWHAYVSIQKSIDALASIGLELDGGSSDKKTGCQPLYGAMTAAANALFACFGIEPGTVYAEQLDMLLSHHAGSAAVADPESMKKSLEKMTSSALEIADTAEKATLHLAEPGTALYDVTVSMSGGVTVSAKSEAEAMDKANAMGTDEIVQKAAWDYPSATDAHTV